MRISSGVCRTHGLRLIARAAGGSLLRQVLRLLSLADEPAPALERATLRLRCGKLRDREAIAPLPRQRRIDDHERAENHLDRVDERNEQDATRAREDED